MTTDTEGLIERVAKAMFDAEHAGLSNCYEWDDHWEEYQECERDKYYTRAKAAIAALQQPDERDAEIARLRSERNDLRMLLARFGDRIRMASASQVWRRVIDDALAQRCAKCGGRHAAMGFGGDCLGPPIPPRPPHGMIA